MAREFEIFRKESAPAVAVKRGFSWPGFFFEWLWAFRKGLWLQGSLILTVHILVGAAVIGLTQVGPVLLPSLVGLLLSLITGFNGNAWRSRKLERQGYAFSGVAIARSPKAAVAAAALGKAQSRATAPPPGFFSVPAWCRGLLAITWLTWKAAFRFRLFLVVAGLLLICVVGLPLLIEDDGTARGFTQIILTYTLTVITGLLGLSTLWLSCGTLARDIEECQMQMLAVKPIARWQIWLGKWFGIVSLNAVLLAIAGASVFVLLQLRATRLSAEEQTILRNEVLVARGSIKPPDQTREMLEKVEKELAERLKNNPVTDSEKPLVRQQVMGLVKADYEAVLPNYFRMWQVDLGAVKDSLKGRPLQLRVKFNTGDQSMVGTFAAMWQVGLPQKTAIWQPDVPQSLSPNTFHEFEIPPDLFDENGLLTIQFYNPNDSLLLFPMEDGIEVLYPEGTFGLNFIRGLCVILCWMSLLAALGLSAATFLSFPVAAFFSLAMLVVSLSSGTLANAISDGTVMGSNSETGEVGSSIVDAVVIPVFRAALVVINFARDFSPIDALSSGRSITWGQLAQAFGQIVLILGGFIALVGIYIFNRRELATAQGNQ